VIGYSVVNSCRLRASGQVTIDVNQRPVAVPKSITVFRGEPVVLPVTGLATDAEALTITAIDGAPPWVSSESDRLVISPPVGITPSVSLFTVTVADPGGLTAAVDVTVTVGNRAPVANDDTVDVTDGLERIMDLVANDTDADSGGVLVVSELLPGTLTFSGGGTGSVTLVDNRSVRVVAGDGRGVATFTYRVRDIDGADSASATVTVNGPPANRPPVAADQAISVTIRTSTVVDLQATDPDGPTPSIVDATFSDPSSVVTSRNGLQLSILALTPGTFVVTYQVTDGEATSAPATLTITASAPTPTTTTTTTPTTTPKTPP
jgi:large repetitive protein